MTQTRTVVATRTPSRTPLPTTPSTGPLNALFSYAPRAGDAPLTVHFYDHSSGPVARRSWSFGDEHGYSTQADPVYTFSRSGTYVVRLTVYDRDGGVDSIAAFVVVNLPATLTRTSTVTRTSISNSPVPTRTALPPMPSSTFTSVPPFVTNTPAVPTVEASATPVPPSFTPTHTNTATSTNTPVSPGADLGVDLNLSDSTPAEGTTISYTVSVTNYGVGTASSVQVSLLLPSEVTFVLALPVQGAYSSMTGQWSVGSLPNGASTSLTLYATVNSQTVGTLVETSATVSDSAVSDPQPANNTASRSFASTTPTSSADLLLTMNVSSASPYVGGVLIYSLTVFNAGPNTATDVEVLDLLPDGLTFQSWTGIGSYDQVSGLWDVGTLVPGGSATLNLRTAVSGGTEGAEIANNAGITALAQADPDGSNNSASTVVTVQSRGVHLVKFVSDTTPIVGQEIVFGIRVTNNMSISATGVRVEDTLPPELTLVLSNPDQGTFSGTLWDVGTIPPGEDALLQLRVRVEASAAGRTIRNSASVIALDQPDSNAANNSDYEDVFVPTQDLAITKRVSSALVAEQAHVTYTIDVFNNAATDAADVLVDDLLPSTLLFDSAIPTQGHYDETSGVWNVGTLTAGNSATLTITAQVNGSPGTVITNTATVSLASGSDPNPANNSASASINVFSADLRVIKSVSDTTPIVGQTITYTVRVVNSMQVTAAGILIEDVLPAGLSYHLSSPYSASHGVYDISTGLWSIPALLPGAAAQLDIRAVVENEAAGSSVTNTAVILDSDQPDSNPANDSASVTISVPSADADLQVTKMVTDVTPNEGQLITYVITVRNSGPSRATGVTLTDLLPSSVALVSVTPSGTTSYDQASGLWTVGTLANGAQQTLTMTASVNSGTVGSVITNTASVTNLTQNDPDLTNNSATVDSYVPGAELSLRKDVDSGIAYENELVTYTLTVTNHGPDDTTSVEVTDSLPIGVRYVSDDGNGQYDPATGLWTVGSLMDGASASLNIITRVENGSLGGTIDNHAYLSYFALPDLNSSNNSDNAVVNVVPRPSVDLSVMLSVSNTAPAAGETIDYTLTLTNNSAVSAANVQVTNALPVGLAFSSASASAGAFSVDTWSVAALAANSSAVLTITAEVQGTPGAILTNSAVISASGFNDRDASDNTASVDISISGSLSLVSLCSANPSVERVWLVTNPNPRDLAFAWSLVNTVHSGVAVVPAAASGIPGEIIVTTSTVAGMNTLAVSVGTVEHVRLESSAELCETDLAVSSVTSNPTPVEGENIVFTTTLSNAGAYTANNIQLQNTISAGLTFVDAVADQGIYDPTAHTWYLPSLSDGTTATLTIQARVNTLTAGMTLTNDMAVTAMDRGDPDMANNVAVSSVEVQTSQVDLAVGISVDHESPAAGDLLTYTITITNQGSAAVGAVRLNISLGSGLSISGSAAGQGTYSGDIWDVGDLVSGASATLSVVARVENGFAGAVLDNTASITNASQPDPDPSNNSASVSVSVIPLPVASFSVEPASGEEPLSVIFTNTSSGDIAVYSWDFGDGSPVSTSVDPGTHLYSVPGTYPVSLSVTGLGGNASTTREVVVVLRRSDLRMDISSDNAAPIVGSDTLYTLSVTNDGPRDVAGVQVNITAPTELALISAVASQGSYDGMSWSVGEIAVGASATLELQMRVGVVPSGHALSVFAVLGGTDYVDMDSSNDEAALTVIVE